MNSLYSKCNLCPRKCGADRNNGSGFCGMDSKVRVARSALHMWEEPCISGEAGAGTIFFVGCSLRCRYCQNYKISSCKNADDYPIVSDEELVQLMLKLENQGANNIDLVTPTHYVPNIINAVKLARAEGLTLPIVYNCGGYESLETLDMLKDTVDIFMPDFKYWSCESSASKSMCADYPDVCKEALNKMYELVGPIQMKDGLLKRGMLVRHMVLPGATKEAIEILRYLAETFADNIIISLMCQYTPTEMVAGDESLGRRITKREYEKVVNEALALGLNNVYIQDRESADASYTPDFNGI